MHKLIHILIVGILSFSLCSCDSGSSSYTAVEHWEYVPSPEWSPDENDLQTDYYGNVSFRAREQSDGYIKKGKVTLYNLAGSGKTFEYYEKSTQGFVKANGMYYQISGSGAPSTVTISNVKYKCN